MHSKNQITAQTSFLDCRSNQTAMLNWPVHIQVVDSMQMAMQCYQQLLTDPTDTSTISVEPSVVRIYILQAYWLLHIHDHIYNVIIKHIKSNGEIQGHAVA